MTKVHIPKDVKLILEELIHLVRDAVDINEDSLTNPDIYAGVEFNYSDDDIENLITAIRFIGHRWCEIDPIEYDCKTPKGSSKSQHLLFYRNNKDTPNDIIEFKVPLEIYEIVDTFSEPEPGKAVYDFVTKLNELLSKLRDRIITRAQLKVYSAEVEYSEGGSQNDKDTTSKPRLTNSDRTIVCGKSNFDFTVQQAKVIKIMWQKGINSKEFYQEQEILEKAGIGRTSFANVFKSRRKEFKAVFEQHKSMKDCWRINLGQTDD